MALEDWCRTLGLHQVLKSDHKIGRAELLQLFVPPAIKPGDSRLGYENHVERFQHRTRFQRGFAVIVQINEMPFGTTALVTADQHHLAAIAFRRDAASLAEGRNNR